MIGSIISVTAVAFYTGPYEMITKMLIVSGAIGGVSFPAFSSSFRRGSGVRRGYLPAGVWKVLFVLTFPVILIIVLFSTELMSVWLGATFAVESVRVLQVLAIGIFIFGMESIPYMLVQGAGRPDITKLPAFELPFYVALIWWLTKQYGINGAAIAWLVRVSADTVLLMFIGNRILPVARASLARLVWGFAVCICALFAAMGASSLRGCPRVGLAGFAVFAWLILLSSGESGILPELHHAPVPAAS